HFSRDALRTRPAVQMLLTTRDQALSASAAMCALTILSGSFTGSPRLILSTFSMPEVTLPQTVYWPLRKDASAQQMKNWLSPESGLAARAIAVLPRTCGSLLNSAFSFLPAPPPPVPCG